MVNEAEAASQSEVILLVDADCSHSRLVKRALENDSDTRRVAVATSLAEARQWLASCSPDLVIADEDLPDGKGSELIGAGEPQRPVVILSRRGDEQTAVDVLKRGALDYVVKDFERLLDMPHIVTRALREWRHILECRRAEDALREREERYRVLTEHAYDLVAEIDESGTLVYVSPNHGEVLGFDAADLLGTDAAERVHPDDRVRAVAMFGALLEPGTTVRDAFRYRSYRGTWRWIETTARSYRTMRGEYRVVFCSRDITDRRELEERLRQSQKLEAVGQLAGGIAHDFNNLLTVMAGYAEQLVETLAPGSEHYEAAQQIVAAADRSAALTRQLLAFSRSQVLQPRELDLNEIITDLGKMLCRLIGEDIELELDLDPTIAYVEADRSQIEQVIVNLTVNARDAMDSGGRLTISTRRIDPDRVRLRVRDTGHGMDDATRERIFEPFFTTKQVGEGTGQGLSTVYGIVCQSGGSISVDSEPGRGSTFDIVLPAHRAEAGTHAPAPARASLRPEGHGVVLLVEDETEVRNLLRTTLERAGYDVTAVANGAAALAAIGAGTAPFDLLLTDIVMPGIDGIELADRVRALWPDLPVLFMSGYTERKVAGRSRALPEGASVIAKPFRMGELEKAVRTALA